MNAVLAAVAVAAASYCLGCLNGAIAIAKIFYRDDVRTHGSGNAGLTNFIRSYGAKLAPLVICVDMGKAAVSVLIGSFAGALVLPPEQAVLGKFFAALFCILGHIFPVTAKGKGGKGILCGGTLLLMLDWRIALVGWGLFFLCVLTTRYVSLGSIAATVSLPVMSVVIYDDPLVILFAAGAASLVVWAHRENIKRLLNGTENKFSLHKKAPKPEEKQ